METIDVSVIVINYNTYKITSDCLKSLYQQTTDINFEVVLVDNASAECDAALFKKEFPQLVLVKSETNLGFAGGNNLGISQAKGKYILLLNSDTVLVENSIKHTYDKFLTFKKPAFTGVKNIYPDGRLQFTSVFLPSLKNLLLRVFYITRLLQRTKKYSLLNQDFSPEALFGSYLFFDRVLLSHFEGNKLNELFFMYHEDLLWCWEARKAGFKNYFIASTSIIHLVGGSITKKARTPERDKEHRNNFIILEKKINGIFYPVYRGLKKIVEWKQNLVSPATVSDK